MVQQFHDYLSYSTQLYDTAIPQLSLKQNYQKDTAIPGLSLKQ